MSPVMDVTTLPIWAVQLIRGVASEFIYTSTDWRRGDDNSVGQMLSYADEHLCSLIALARNVNAILIAIAIYKYYYSKRH